jgi:hypothetical protein
LSFEDWLRNRIEGEVPEECFKFLEKLDKHGMELEPLKELTRLLAVHGMDDDVFFDSFKNDLFHIDDGLDCSDLKDWLDSNVAEEEKKKIAAAMKAAMKFNNRHVVMVGTPPGSLSRAKFGERYLANKKAVIEERFTTKTSVAIGDEKSIGKVLRIAFPNMSSADKKSLKELLRGAKWEQLALDQIKLRGDKNFICLTYKEAQKDGDVEDYFKEAEKAREKGREKGDPKGEGQEGATVKGWLDEYFKDGRKELDLPAKDLDWPVFDEVDLLVGEVLLAGLGEDGLATFWFALDFTEGSLEKVIADGDDLDDYASDAVKASAIGKMKNALESDLNKALSGDPDAHLSVVSFEKAGFQVSQERMVSLVVTSGDKNDSILSELKGLYSGNGGAKVKERGTKQSADGSSWDHEYEIPSSFLVVEAELEIVK